MFKQINYLKDYAKQIEPWNHLRKVVKEYNFYYLYDLNYSNSQNSDTNIHELIKSDIEKSKVIIIDHYQNEQSQNLYFILSFRHTILIIKSSCLNYIRDLISKNLQINLFFIDETKTIFDNNIKLYYNEITNHDYFTNEITNFTNNNEIINFIKEIYLKSISINRITNFSNKPLKKKFKEEDLIILKQGPSGSLFKIDIVYLKEEKIIVAIKKKNSYGNEYKKLIDREKENYEIIDHLLIPKFYGTVKTTEKEKYLVIEYINGTDLLYHKNFQYFSEGEILTIIFQLILIIQYLHENDFIYRDLKPNNIMIDEFKNAVLIDFDRMIKSSDIIYNSEDNSNNTTQDLSNRYLAPEIASKPTFKCDIYSYGRVLEFILGKLNPVAGKKKLKEFITSLKNICIRCEPDNRPTSEDIITNFFKFILNNNTVLDRLDPITYFKVAEFLKEKNHYLKNDYYSLSEKSFLLATESNQQMLYAFNYLGLIYEEKNNIDKAIECYKKVPKNKNILYKLGILYFQKKKFNTAKNNFEKTINEKPKIYDSYYYLGLIYEEENEIDLAIKYLSKLTRNPDALYNLARIFKNKKNDIKNALKCYIDAANLNHPIALYIAGTYYEEGKYVLKNIKTAINYYKRASYYGYAESSFRLGTYYENGINLEKNIDIAKEYYSKAAALNHPQALFNLGLLYEKDNNLEKAFEYYKKAAEYHLPSAQFVLGNMYYEGIDNILKKNINKSIYYFYQAAKQNYSDASANLGYIYSESKMIPSNAIKAKNFLEQAAKNGNSKAQFFLGLFYFEGKHLKKDTTKGIYYYKKSANQNNSHAQCNLGIIYFKGLNIKRNIKAAIDLFKLSANQNNKCAHYNLGLIYLNNKCYFDSIFHFYNSATQNLKESQFILSLIYLNNDDERVKNINRGLYWIEKSSKNESKNACFHLGFLYHEGKYVRQNIKEAIKHYKNASNLNYSFAYNNLGVIYKNGFQNEIDKDLISAKEYLEKGVELNDYLSMYNLSHLFIFEEQNEDNNIDYPLKLLIKSSNLGFAPSTQLLSLLLIKKHGLNYKKMNSEIIKTNIINDTSEIMKKILLFIKYQKFDKRIALFENVYESYRKTDFLYDQSFNEIVTKFLNNSNKIIENKQVGNKITSDFYEGFD